MDANKFARLEKSMRQGLSHAKGQKRKTRETTFEILEPKVMTGEQIKALRKNLKMSQPVFAMLINVSDDAVKAWEQNRNKPSGAALRMLELIKRNPQDFLEQAKETGFLKYG